MRQNPLPIQFAECVARRRYGSTAKQPELRIARRLELSIALLGDPLDVAHGEQAAQPIIIIYHQQLVDAWPIRKKLIGPCDRISAEFLLIDSLDLLSGS